MWYAIDKREGQIWHGTTYGNNLNFFHNYSNRLVNSAKDDKISKKNLAQQIDIDSQTLTRCLTGDNFPSVLTLLKIGKYEGKSVSYLIGENKEETANETSIVDYLGITNDAYNNLINIRNTNKEKNNNKYDILGKLVTNVDLYKKIMNEIISLKSKRNITKDEIEFSVFKISNAFNELTAKYIKDILKKQEQGIKYSTPFQF